MPETMNRPLTPSADDLQSLERLGYKQELKRGLNGFMTFAIGFSMVNVTATITVMFTFGIVTVGPVAMVWGWIIASLFTIIVSHSLAEICAVYLGCGSVYNWSGQLAPREWAPYASYWAGIFNWLGLIGLTSAYASAFGIFVSAGWYLSGFSLLSTDVQVAISVASVLLWTSMNCFPVEQMGWLSALAAFIMVATSLIIFFAILLMAPALNTSEYVFFDYNNDTGFTSAAYVAFISILFSVFTLSGYDASCHMAEETKDSRASTPVSMLQTIYASCIVGFVFILALLYAIQSIHSAETTNLNNAGLAVFLQATNTTCANALTWLLVINIFFGGLSTNTVIIRLSFAMIRDKATPYTEFFSYVDPTYRTPVNIALVLFFIEVSLQLLALSSAGEYALYSLVGISAVGFSISYFIPIAIKYFFPPDDFVLTSMSLGKWSNTFAVISLFWLGSTTIICLFPDKSPITAASMNYSIAVVAAVMLSMGINWHFNARYTFRGPKRADDKDFPDPDAGQPSNEPAESPQFDKSPSYNTDVGLDLETEPLLKK